jgi:tetratricopeptide (TPR) repeat protein
MLTAWLALGCLAGPLTAQQQQAQITAEALLSAEVDDFGPKYQDVDTAIEQLRGGRLAEARETLLAARRKNPNLPPANLMLAQILFRLQQVQQGQLALEEAVKEDPADPGTYLYLGEIALQSRRFAEARMDYEKALELAQKYSANEKRKNRAIVGAYTGLGTLAEINEDWQTARQHLDKVRQMDPQNTLALTRLGRVMFKLAGNLDEEREVFAVFKQVHSADPNTTAYPDVNMALLYEQAGKTANAKKLMERAIQSDAQNPRTLLAVAKWSLDRNELQLADQALQAALQLDPNSAEAQIYLGLLARYQNDLAKAEEALKTAHFLAPANLAAITQLAQVLVESADEKKHNLALNYARLGTQLYPDLKEATGREAAVTVAWVLSRMKQDTSAARAIEQVLRAGDGRISADSGYHAAQILYNQGMSEAARQLLEQSLQADPAFPNRAAAEQLLARIRNR